MLVSTRTLLSTIPASLSKSSCSSTLSSISVTQVASMVKEVLIALTQPLAVAVVKNCQTTLATSLDQAEVILPRYPRQMLSTRANEVTRSTLVMARSREVQIRSWHLIQLVETLRGCLPCCPVHQVPTLRRSVRYVGACVAASTHPTNSVLRS